MNPRRPVATFTSEPSSPLSCLNSNHVRGRKVVAVNVTRMTILGLSEWHYATLHNQWSDAVTNVITLGLIVGISALGVRRELLQLI